MIFAIASLLLVSACASEKIVVTNAEDAKDINKVSVNGFAELEVAPDQAVLRFSVVTENSDVKKAQSKNSEIANQVINALKSSGVDKKEIETVDYFVTKIQEWENNKYVDKGYRVKNTIKITTKDLGKIGSFIDTAVSNGVNDFDAISFELSKEAKEKVAEQLLTKASEDAKNKAELLTKALDVKLGKAVTISESNYDIAPRYYGGLEYKSMMADNLAPTPIQPENVETSARISVVFQIE